MKNILKTTHVGFANICISLVIVSGLSVSSLASANSFQGGQLTLNLDNTAFAGAFSHNHDPSRPSIYLEEYFNSAQAASRSSSDLLADHIIPGTGEISAIGREFLVNSSTVSGLNQATNFSFDASDLTGTASGAIGLGGAMRFRVNVPFTISGTGEEVGNRVISAFLSMDYDANRIDIAAGHSGWALVNHHTFTADVFSLDNVVTNLTANTLSLSGELSLASGFAHLGGVDGAVVGDFNFQTTVVPLPAAVWFFASGLAGLGFFRGRKHVS